MLEDAMADPVPTMADLRAALMAAQAREAALAEVLAVINANPDNLAPVFATILDKAHQTCGASMGALFLYDGAHVRAAATHGYSDQIDVLLRAPNLPTPAHENILGGARCHHLPDLKALPVPISPLSRLIHSETDVRTNLMIPLRRDGRVLGFISANRPEVRPYTEAEIVLLENFAAQAVIAMENARLLCELRARTEEIAGWNRELEARVAAQLDELARVGRLKRFLAPQLAEMIVSQGDEKILESHRREIVVVFCDLRGYTAFTETAEPEEVIDFLREYHGRLGPLVAQFEGTIDQFSGDGIMVFFNDPVPTADPAGSAIKMATAMREAAGGLIAAWRELGRALGFGVGIAQGYATLGQIGFADRLGYTAIGTVCNIAARLCGEAKDGQILMSQRVNSSLKGSVATEQIGALTLKGLTQPVLAYNVPIVGGQATLRIIEGGALPSTAR